MKIVIKIGGHLFPSILRLDEIASFVNLLRKLKKKGHGIVVVTGGGEGARKYINLARTLGGSEFVCDLLGIEYSRLNARLLITSLGEDAYPMPPLTFEEVKIAFNSGKIVILGGVQPGQSTNACGILSAEAIGADVFINATDVDCIYTADPNKDPKAKKIDFIKTDELIKLLVSDKVMAGSYELFDLIAVKIIERSGIKAYVVNGKKLENIEKIIEGKHIGTLIEPP